jgi:starch-binding outer membrane protein, SusD/RagB family
MSADRVIPVIRLAEVYLARAEAIAVQDNAVTQPALDDLNEIRTRAGIPALNIADFAVNGLPALMDSIKLEKKREFLYEGLIFHDLKRWKDGIGNPAVVATDSKFILPIPQAETDTWK